MEQNRTKLKQSLQHYDKIVVTALSFIALGTVFYHMIEKLSWVDSLYFTVITLATVGYGDITPQTTAGKLFTIAYVVIGITIFIALAKVVLAKLVLYRIDKK